MKHKKNALPILYCAIFILLCLIPSAGMLILPESPNFEKRELAEFPALTENGTFNEHFPSQFEDYFSDHFALRSYIVSADAALKYYGAGYSGNPAVVAGREGCLFFSSTMDDYYRTNAVNDTDLFRLVQTVELMNGYCQSKDIPFLLMVAPNKNSVYPEWMPAAVSPGEGKNNLEKLTQALSGRDYFLDVKRLFDNTRYDPVYYHKLDSHWNNLGGRRVYAAVMQNLAARRGSFAYDDYAAVMPAPVENWQGDLDQMLLPTLGRRDLQYDFGIQKEYKAQKPITDPMALSISTTSAKNDRSVLFFRDSFFSNLIDFFSNNLGEAEYTRAVPYQFELAEKKEYDGVVLEIVERNLMNLLGSTPVFAAREVQEPLYADNEREDVLPCTLTPKGKLTLVSGTIPEGWMKPGVHIYLAIQNAENRRLYEAFPICSDPDGTLEENAKVSNGYSLYVDTQILGDNDTISVLVYGPEGTVLFPTDAA